LTRKVLPRGLFETRRSATSKASRKSKEKIKASKREEDKAGDKYVCSDASQQSRISIQSVRSNKSNESFHSAASRQSVSSRTSAGSFSTDLTSIGEETPTLVAVESHDELPEGTRVRTASASSTMTTSSATSMSRKTSMSRREHNELKMLGENN